jgi:AAT family amino acid transporter
MNKFENESLWLERKKSIEVIPQPLRGILGIVIALAVFVLVWYVFMNMNGILKWYTPLYGYMYISVVLLVTICQVYIFDFWPLNQRSLEKLHPLIKLVTLVAINVVLTWFLVWIFFYKIIGTLAIPYFSWPALENLGLLPYTAREYSAQGILMFAGVAAFFSPMWMILFQNHPWQDLKQPVKGFSVLSIVLLLSTFTYFIFMHPQFQVLFYPWQKYVAAFPWWTEFSSTVSGNFGIGVIVCMTVSLWLFETIWERYPYRLIKSQPLRGLAGFGCVVLLGLSLFVTNLLLQDIAWGSAVPGASLMGSPSWRYVHAGEISVMLLLVAVMHSNYFDNWPRKFSVEVNILIRTVITVVGAVLFNYLYYKFNPVFLGTQAGYAHQAQFTMAPFMLLLVVMLMHNWFMDSWPGKKTAVTLKQQRAMTTETDGKVLEN